MNQMVFNQAISYIDTDIVELFFDMKSKKENQVNFRTKPHSFLKWGAIAAVLCFALATSFVMILINHTNQSFNLPTTADNILWYDDNSVVCNESASIVKWNGINVSSDLYEVLNQAKRDKYIAVIIKYRNEDNFNNIIIYQSEDGETKIDVKLENETVWLSQQQMALLFKTSRTNIVEHINNIYLEGELDKISTCQNFRQVESEHSRNIERISNN